MTLSHSTMTLSQSLSGGQLATSGSTTALAAQPPILRADLDENEKKVILEFTHLLEKVSR